MVPGGMRIGTPALTTRGFKEAEFVQVADFIDRAVKIAKDCQQKTPAPGELMYAAGVVVWQLLKRCMDGCPSSCTACAPVPAPTTN